MNRFLPSVALITLGLLAAAGCRGGAHGRAGGGEPAAETPRVQVVKPARKPLTFTLTRPGHIEAFEQTPLFPKVEGYVGKTREVEGKDGKATKKAIADIGDRVTEGEVLAEILVPELLEEYAQEKALLKQAEVGVEVAAKTVLVAEKFEQSAKAQVAEAEAGVTKAEGVLQFAKSEHQRISELAQSKSVPKQLLDEKVNQLHAAEAARAEADAKVQSMKATHAEAHAKIAKTKADEVAAAAHVQVATAKVAKVKALVDYTRIRAPFDGVVTERNVDTGHYVRPPQGMTKPMYVVTRTDIMRVFVDVPETEAALVGDDDEAVIQVQALKGKEIKGAVTRKSGALDPVSRTLKTEIDLPNKGVGLLPGMYVMVRISLKGPSEVLAVPAKALVQDGAKTLVACVENGKVIRKAVTIGLQSGGDVEIISGLTGNETIVRDNAAALKDGQEVEVITTAAP